MRSNETLPVATLGEALEHLCRPVPPEAIRFKVQSESDRAGLVVGYIDSRVVYERLNQVVGERWSHDFRPLADGLRPEASNADGGAPLVFVVCRLTVCAVTHEDVGEGHDPKAAFSDAVKRAAVPFGVGRFLYAMRTPWMREGARDSDLRRGSAKRRLLVDERTERWLRDQYGRWLAGAGERFGAPLGHGDDGGPPAAEAAEEAADGEVVENGDGNIAPAMKRFTESRPTGRGVLDAQMAAGGFSEATVARLIALLYGEAMALRTSQYTELAALLDDAARGGIDDRTLALAIERCARSGSTSAAFRDWVRERAERARAA